MSALEECVGDARAARLSRNRVKNIVSPLERNMSVFKFRLVAGCPANTILMGVDLNPKTKPVKGKVKTYSAEKRPFLKIFVKQLAICGLLIAKLAAR